MCNTCREKGKRVGDYNGCFSVNDFKALADQRNKMQKDIVEKDRRIGELISLLTQAQREKEYMVKQSDRLLSE